MKLQAIIFDLYKTVLDVQAAPADAEQRWARLWNRMLSQPPRLSLAEFRRDCDLMISMNHTAASRAGVLFPEVYWPEILGGVIPEILRLPPEDRDEFELEQARLWHSVTLMDGAARCLAWIDTQALRLGIASNCQPYTLVELEECLNAAGLSSHIFDPALRFLSFEHGFSKPNPHAFRFLTAQLKKAGTVPQQVLMVGDREDNDLAPARAQGWQTWRLGASSTGTGTGTDVGGWTELLDHLQTKTG